MGLHSGDKGKGVLDKDTIWSSIRDPNDYDDDDEEDEEEEEDHDHDYVDEEEEDPRKKHKPKPALYRGESSASAKIKSARKSTAAKTLPRRRTSVGNIFVDDIAAAAASGPEDFTEEEAMHENDDCFHGAAKRNKVSTGNAYSTKNLRNCNNATAVEETEEEECEMDDDEVELVSPESSKFWKVKCKSDRELEAVTTLMQKSIDMKAIGKSLLIKSAIAPTHLKGYIYIEAENELLASQACRGMTMLASFKPLFVPSTEIANITQIVKASPVRKGDWVRLKAGLYKGDFAKVLSLVNCKQKVNVQLVPRISLHDLKEKMDLVATRPGRELTKKSNCSGIEEEEKSLKTQAGESRSHCDGLEKEGKNLKTKAESRPPPCFITENEIRKLSIPVKQKKIKEQILYSVGNMLFMDGYLVKKVALRSLDITVKPTLEELQMFQRPGGKDSAAVFNSSSFIKSARFMEGDTVMVVEGDHQSLVGYVERVDGDKVSIRATSEKKQEVVVLHKKQIVKFFRMGDHVQVLEGSYQGATGIIVDADKLHAVILSDATKEEIRVMKDCVAPSSEVASVMSKLGEFNLFDLVLLDHSKCGLILRIEKERLQVLKGIAEKVETSMVKPTDVQKRVISNNTSVRDSGNNMIHVKDSVEVLEGTFKGKKGPVHHIYGDLLFIHDPDHLENSGFMCIRTNECLVFGGKRAGTFRHNQNSTDFSRKRRQYHQEDGGNFEKRERICKEDSMIGHNVIVKRGMCKGYRGRVVRATGPFRQVYLETQMRIITLQANELKDLDPVIEVGNGAADWTAAQDSTSNASEGNNMQQEIGWGSDATEQKDDTWNANGQDGWGTRAEVDKENTWGATVDKKDDAWEGGEDGCLQKENTWGANVDKKDDAWGGGEDGCLQKEDLWGTSSKEDGKNEWEATADKENETWGGGNGCPHKENNSATSFKDGQSGWGGTVHISEVQEKNARQDTGDLNIDKEAEVFDNEMQNSWENTKDDMEWKSFDDETPNGSNLRSPEEEAQVQNASDCNPSSQQDNWAAASICESGADESGW